MSNRIEANYHDDDCVLYPTEQSLEHRTGEYRDNDITRPSEYRNTYFEQDEAVLSSGTGREVNMLSYERLFQEETIRGSQRIGLLFTGKLRQSNRRRNDDNADVWRF